MKFKFHKIAFLVLLFSLTACSQRKKISDQDTFKIKVQLARLSDVPVPVGIEPVLDWISENSFGYLVQDNLIDLLQYYQLKMDQYGWQLVGLFDGNNLEKQLIFQKPHKLVSISIRKQASTDNSLRVLILSLDK
jgi:hypothetical protein